MKNSIKKTFSIILCFLAINLQSANSSEIIAVIDVERISKEAKVVKYIGKMISRKRDSYQKEISSKEEELTKERDKIKAKQNILSQKALESQQNSFLEKIKTFKSYADKKDLILKKAYSKSLSKVNSEVEIIVSDIAKEKDFLVVIPASSLFYSKAKIDITGEVIEKLNKKMTKLKVEFED